MVSKLTTRTGIVIGRAYTPPRGPEYACAIERPSADPVTEAGHRAVVWVGLVALISAVVLVTLGVL